MLSWIKRQIALLVAPKLSRPFVQRWIGAGVTMLGVFIASKVGVTLPPDLLQALSDNLSTIVTAIIPVVLGVLFADTQIEKSIEKRTQQQIPSDVLNGARTSTTNQLLPRKPSEV